MTFVNSIIQFTNMGYTLNSFFQCLEMSGSLHQKLRASSTPAVNFDKSSFYLSNSLVIDYLYQVKKRPRDERLSKGETPYAKRTHHQPSFNFPEMSGIAVNERESGRLRALREMNPGAHPYNHGGSAGSLHGFQPRRGRGARGLLQDSLMDITEYEDDDQVDTEPAPDGVAEPVQGPSPPPYPNGNNDGEGSSSDESYYEELRKLKAAQASSEQ